MGALPRPCKKRVRQNRSAFRMSPSQREPHGTSDAVMARRSARFAISQTRLREQSETVAATTPSRCAQTIGRSVEENKS